MSRLSISLLGPFQVLLEGQPVTGFESDKARALLAYLALESDIPQRREALAGLLWPDRPERAARRNLSQALYNLRTTLGDEDAPFLVVTHQAISFDRSSDHWLDAAAFVRQMAEVQGHAHPTLAACSPCIERLEQAVALYRGAFLAGFSLGDSASFEEWMRLRQEGFHRQVIDALRRLAASCGQRGEVERGLAHARRWVELEPWQENAHRQVMRLLALSGKRSAALAQYEACRRMLEEELDVEPSAEMTRLYERIREGESIGEDEAIGAGGSEPRAHNLPVQLVPFVGRAKVLAEIEARLWDPGCRLLTLVGPGGSGKTRLALEAAARQVDRYPHGAWFVPLAPLRSVEAIVPTVAQSLGLTFQGGGLPQEQLLNYLRHKHLLLVLDNFEHLVEGATVVADILHAAPEVEVLVTSRVGLSLNGEHRFPVSGMDVPALSPSLSPSDPAGGDKGEELADALQYSAVRLFAAGARRAQPGFELTDDNLADVVRICRLVGGMPLGLLLASAWVEMLTPGEIARELAPEAEQSPGLEGEQGLDFLASDLRDVPERQRSMRTVFDHSWHLLSPGERTAFQELSVFRGGFTREAAQQVTGISLRELKRLVDRSLLHRTPLGRYEIHELLRQYAAQRLCESSHLAAADGAAEDVAARQRHCLSVHGKECVATHERHCAAVRDRHSATYAAALQRWAADLKGARQQAALAEMEVDAENARAAWDWAVERVPEPGQVERLGQAMDGLGLFFDWRVRYAGGEALFQAAADALTGLAGGALLVRARALAWQGHFCHLLGRIDPARDLLRQSLSLLDSPAAAGPPDTRRERAFVLRVIGEIEYRGGDRNQAEPPHRQSLALYRELGDRWETARALYALGLNVLSLASFEETKRLAQGSLDIYRTLGDHRGMVDCLASLAVVAQEQGEFENSERLTRQSLAIGRAMGDRATLARVLRSLATALAWRGKLVESHSIWREYAVICQDLGSPDELAYAFILLGLAEVHLGQYEPARPRMLRGLELARESGELWRMGFARFSLSHAPLVEGEFGQAGRLLQEGLALFSRMGAREQMCWTYALLGYAACGQGDLALARQHLCQALQIATVIRSVLATAWMFPPVALYLAGQGKIEHAVEIYALASRQGFVAHSRWFEDVFGRQIAAAAATLEPEVVAGAQERGRGRDLWATVEELLDELSG